MKEAVKEQEEITKDLEDIIQSEKSLSLRVLTVDKEQSINELLREKTSL